MTPKDGRLLIALLAVSLALWATVAAQSKVPAKPQPPPAKASNPVPLEPVAVIGEVVKPGTVPFVPGLTLKGALEAVGGLTPNADAQNIALRRLGSGIGTVDGQKALAGDAVQNIALKPGDTLVVPRLEKTEPPPHAEPAKVEKLEPTKPVEEPPKVEAPKESNELAGGKPEVTAIDPSTRIAIVGSVGKPGTFIYEPLMIQEALEAAGGLNKDAESKKIVVRRGYLIDPPSSRSFTYDFDLVKRKKSADIALLPGDVIEVPKRGKKTFLGTVGGAMGKVGDLVAAVAKPLIGAKAPGLAAGVLPPSKLNGIGGAVDLSGAGKMTGGRAPTALEAALFQAISVESPEVRERIFNQARLYLAANR